MILHRESKFRRRGTKFEVEGKIFLRRRQHVIRRREQKIDIEGKIHVENNTYFYVEEKVLT